MKTKMKYLLKIINGILLLCIFISIASNAQEVKDVKFKVTNGLSIVGVKSLNVDYAFEKALPFFSIEINDRLVNLVSAKFNDESLTLNFPSGLVGDITTDKKFWPVHRCTLIGASLENAAFSSG